MDGFNKALFHFSSSVILFLTASGAPAAGGGYFQLHNLMSAAQKNIPSNVFFNDTKLSLERREKGTGHVVNTQFANNGGMAGCGISSTLVQYMYQNSSTVDLSKNYVALNVYSQVMGFNPDATFWGNPEGQVKGYMTQLGNATQVAYPNIPYHRQIPSLYPAYLGLYNNGLNCGRWVQAQFDTTNCLDRTTASGISKSCPDVSALTYAGEQMQGYIFDSCEDNNGWCRDDAAHPDFNGGAFKVPNNYYLQWQFIRNPYYADAKAPTWLKDIWLAWFGQASKYWSYIAVLNMENGISGLQYNIGTTSIPVWTDSHVLAGDNNITWSSTSNNGELWQIEPVGSLTDAGPSNNPLYQMRYSDTLGYPANHGAIYQFHLTFDNGSAGESVAGYSVFYKGGATVKSGTQTPNVTVLNAPVGTGRITVDFGSFLPAFVSLQPTASNWLRPVLTSDAGYTYDAAQCIGTKCVFAGLPLTGSYQVFAHAMNEGSNDLTMRMVNDIAISSGKIAFPSGTTLLTYTLKSTDINLSTLYAARVVVPLSFTGFSGTAFNGNLQAFFVPDSSKNGSNISAETQGCFLSTWVKSSSATASANTTVCTVYYTVNHQTAFGAAPASATFNVILPAHVGYPPLNYALTQPYSASVKVTGYVPSDTAFPVAQTVPMATYQPATDTFRTLYWMLDPFSDAVCLNNLTSVSVTGSDGSTVSLTQPGIPVESRMGTATPLTNASASVKLRTTDVTCQGMLSLVPASATLKPGIDVIDVVKLVKVPTLQASVSTQGIRAQATGDAACMGGQDVLSFSMNGAVVVTAPYTVSGAAVNVGVDAALGTYTLSDQPFKVPGGNCQLTGKPTVTLQNNVWTPVTLNYQLAATPGISCQVKTVMLGSWPGGCSVQFNLSGSTPLNTIILSWAKGAWNWATLQPWGGQGSLSIPTAGNVTWSLPAWASVPGGSVGFNVTNDTSPFICSAFATGSLTVGCSGQAVGAIH